MTSVELTVVASSAVSSEGNQKLFSCSAQLSMKFYMLISIKISRNSAFSRLR